MLRTIIYVNVISEKQMNTIYNNSEETGKIGFIYTIRYTAIK